MNPPTILPIKTAIAQVIDSTEAGGAERMAIQLANALASATSTSHLIVTRYQGALANQIDTAVQVLVLNRHHMIALKAIRQVIDYIRKWKIRILHAHDWSSAYWCVLWRALGNLPVLIVYHHHESLDAAFLKRVAKLKAWLDRLMLRSTNAVIGVSELIVEHDLQLLSSYGMPIIYLPNGINVAVFQRSNQYHNGCCIVQVANIRPPKGQMHIAAIARHLNYALGEFKWLCIGDLSDQAYYAQTRQRLSQNNLLEKVFFLGGRSDVPDLLATATVGVLTSEAEGLPVALLEYMAAGLPVVVTEVGDCGKVVNEARCGFVIPQGNYAEFAEAIAWLCLNPADAHNMGRRGQLAVQAHYSLEAMMNKLTNFYAKLLSRKSGVQNHSFKP